ncbi:AbrB/MazE/SpoVT family DNA-binding domain-containing protein [Actinoalloteichus hymeniacidonis]|uniref:Looped-hinge helix DNA binding domain, AbrB family n=1 Tax=Actinoalloteichus hymeniacidonis TaxID=340345 RepID=A0AAC9HNG4_9PSEU|nr:AbrB/MazE/SpoVT family DNA-binding domain-containing protein [Actinoalloteichus hymeniacidonis]AOS61986.1 looped-hinge helix DNA binding domain, AbrB family [Actinoalloteichus hymeniacidonis]MBB5909992.1 AbrB family looped-hinge helix DNA binding protein [Actinoalloteichus hymeniacidonis]
MQYMRNMYNMYFMSSNDEETPEVVTGPGDRKFYGSVTVGERGQVVIPARARRDHGFEPGDKLLVLGNSDGLALMSAERLMEVLESSAVLSKLISSARDDTK